MVQFLLHQTDIAEVALVEIIVKDPNTSKVKIASQEDNQCLLILFNYT